MTERPRFFRGLFVCFSGDFSLAGRLFCLPYGRLFLDTGNNSARNRLLFVRQTVIMNNGYKWRIDKRAFRLRKTNAKTKGNEKRGFSPGKTVYGVYGQFFNRFVPCRRARRVSDRLQIAVGKLAESREQRLTKTFRQNLEK